MSFNDITNQPYYNVFINYVAQIEEDLVDNDYLKALFTAYNLKSQLEAFATTTSYFPDCSLVFARGNIIEKANDLQQNILKMIGKSSVDDTLRETVGKQCAILRNYGKLGSFLANLYKTPTEVKEESILAIAKQYKPDLFATPNLGIKKCNGNVDVNATTLITTSSPAIKDVYQNAINLLQLLNETALQNLCEVCFSNNTELKDIAILSEHDDIKGNLFEQAKVESFISDINAYNVAVKKELEESHQETMEALDSEALEFINSTFSPPSPH